MFVNTTNILHLTVEFDGNYEIENIVKGTLEKDDSLLIEIQDNVNSVDISKIIFNVENSFEVDRFDTHISKLTILGNGNIIINLPSLSLLKITNCSIGILNINKVKFDYAFYNCFINNIDIKGNGSIKLYFCSGTPSVNALSTNIELHDTEFSNIILRHGNISCFNLKNNNSSIENTYCRDVYINNCENLPEFNKCTANGLKLESVKLDILDTAIITDLAELIITTSYINTILFNSPLQVYFDNDSSLNIRAIEVNAVIKFDGFIPDSSVLKYKDSNIKEHMRMSVINSILKTSRYSQTKYSKSMLEDVILSEDYKYVQYYDAKIMKLIDMVYQVIEIYPEKAEQIIKSLGKNIPDGVWEDLLKSSTYATDFIQLLDKNRKLVKLFGHELKILLSQNIVNIDYNIDDDLYQDLLINNFVIPNNLKISIINSLPISTKQAFLNKIIDFYSTSYMLPYMRYSTFPGKVIDEVTKDNKVNDELLDLVCKLTAGNNQGYTVAVAFFILNARNTKSYNKEEYINIFIEKMSEYETNIGNIIVNLLCLKSPSLYIEQSVSYLVFTRQLVELYAPTLKQVKPEFAVSSIIGSDNIESIINWMFSSYSYSNHNPLYEIAMLLVSEQRDYIDDESIKKLYAILLTYSDFNGYKKNDLYLLLTDEPLLKSFKYLSEMDALINNSAPSTFVSAISKIDTNLLPITAKNIFKRSQPIEHLEFTSNTIQKLMSSERKKIKDNVLFKKQIRQEGTIYVDTVIEYKSKLDKKSQDYEYIQYVETYMNQKKQTSLSNPELTEVDEHLINNHEGLHIKKTSIINPFLRLLIQINNAMANFTSESGDKQYIDSIRKFDNKDYRKPNQIYIDIVMSVQDLTKHFFEEEVIKSKIRKFIDTHGNNNPNELLMIKQYFESNNKQYIDINSVKELDKLLLQPTKEDISNKYFDIYKLVTIIKKYGFEERPLRMDTQSLIKEQRVFRMNLIKLDELLKIYDALDPYCSSLIEPYIEKGKGHPTSRLLLTLGWIRFNVNEYDKSIWVNEVQTDMSKILKFNEYAAEYSDELVLKLSTNIILSFQTWVKKHYNDYTIIFPSSQLRKSLIGGDPTPNIYDNIPKKLKFQKFKYEDTVWYNIRHDNGIVYTWNPLTEQTNK